MKRLWLLALVGIAVGCAAFFATRHLCLSEPCDEVEWLTREFALTAGQVEKITAIKKAFEPVCADHCAAIAKARQELGQLAQRGVTSGPDYDCWHQRWKDMTRICQTATRNHIQEVASVMTPEQASRYLAAVSPFLEQQGTAAPRPL